MANVRSTILSNFSEVRITSDVSINSTYPVLLIYKNTVLKYTSVVGGSATILGVTYTTSSGVTNLNFASTATLNGTEYQEIITPSFYGSTSETIEDGVYTFKLLDATGVLDITLGEVAYNSLNCCMATKIDKAYATFRSDIISKAETEVIQVSTLIESAKASCLIQDMVNASNKFAIATLICNDCGCSN